MKMDNSETPSMYRRTLRAGLILGVIGVVTIISASQLQMIVMDSGVSQVLLPVFAAIYQLAGVGCLPFSAALVSASLVMRHMDATKASCHGSDEQQPRNGAGG
jgi:hypothetical protein